MRTRHLLRWLSAFAAAIATGGCTTILGVTDVPGEGSPSDGGPPTTDARGHGDSGSSLDATSPRDGQKGVDGSEHPPDVMRGPDVLGPPRDGGPPCQGFCGCTAPDAQFCEDFDDGFGLVEGALTLGDGAAAIVTDAESLSPPNSFESVPGAPVTEAQIDQTFDAGASRSVTLRFSLLAGPCSGESSPQEIAQVLLLPSDTAVNVLGQVMADGGLAFALETVTELGPSQPTSSVSASSGGWVGVSLSILIADGSATANASAGDAGVAADASVGDVGSGPYGVGLYLGNSAMTPACPLYFDNVTFGWDDGHSASMP